MTPEQQRAALAEWAGWEAEQPDWDVGRGFPPDYPRDLNAVHELEGKLTFEQAEQFEDELCHIVVKCNEHQENPAPWRFAVAHATAAQRCEAILKTLNLWKP